MNEQIRTLKADLAADLQAIAEGFAALGRYAESPADEDQLIALGYRLHNLYSAFESVFQRVAETFENQISDRAGWHAELLHRMTLNIEGIRPALISRETYECLDELRRFRHLFRSAYRAPFGDAERLAVVRRKAQTLQRLYPADMARFVEFLNSLIAAE